MSTVEEHARDDLIPYRNENYFDGRAQATLIVQPGQPHCEFPAEGEADLSEYPDDWYRVNGAFEELRGHDTTGLVQSEDFKFNIEFARPLYLYPRPYSVAEVTQYYIVGELSLGEFEEYVEAALRVEGLNWGGVEE